MIEMVGTCMYEDKSEWKKLNFRRKAKKTMHECTVRN